jgi:hypothetical protein
MVFGKETAPRIVQQRAVGLQGIFNLHSGPGVFFLKSNRFAKKVQPHQGGFAALPGKVHLGHALALNVLAGVALQRLIRHAEGRARVQGFLAEIKTIVAVEIANRAARFGHYMKGGGQGNGGHGCALTIVRIAV